MSRASKYQSFDLITVNLNPQNGFLPKPVDTSEIDDL